MAKKFVEYDTSTDSVQLVELSSGSCLSVPVRQTVLAGRIDTNGYANFLEAGTGLAVDLKATSTPVRIAFADGFGDNGAVDYIGSITSDISSAFSSLPASTTSFLYAERNSGTGELSYGSTLVAPQYGYAFDKTQNALLHFDGDDASTTMTDEYGNTWTAQGNAQLDTAQYKFGTSSLLLDGTGDYIDTTDIKSLGDRFTLECFVRFNALPSSGNRQPIFNCKNPNSGYGLDLFLYNNSGTTKFETYLSSDAASYDIASGALGSNTTWATGTWYHIAFVFDGFSYKVYINGTQDINITSSISVCSISGIRLGTNWATSSFLNGWIDEFRFSKIARYTSSFTAPDSAFDTESLYWFDISAMKMKQGNPASWTEKQVVVLGEAVAGSSSISSVTTYALRGMYDSGWFTTTAGTGYNKYHNVGTDQVIIKLYERGIYGIVESNYWYYSVTGHHVGSDYRINRNLAFISANYDTSLSTSPILDRKAFISRTF
ncbi:MAG: hypothetical protein A2287_00105 [Candidatus Melainabacteria bacterium RIFOXYA12_FULL_32_12]|nr:MAG: hypothetical protein A2255_10855 [Candidatus Melainabacteria bacterium RIFOXYA2_FULL_32_9]OGI31815.1 MAG: hypothetical protein A2287_00105 [Candidatus Melainabacteria bacterium RIFOXYA12_FULL_32_12]